MSLHIRMLLLSILLCATLPQNTLRAADPSAQQKCPIMPEEDIDPDIYVDYQGTRVFFCCPRCKAKFKSDPAKYFKLVAAESRAETTTTLPDARTQTTPDVAERGDKATSAAGEETSTGSIWLLRIGRFHIPLTDFPIGVLIAAAIAEFLFMQSGKPLYDSAARYCIWFAAMSAIITVPLGWCLAGFEPLKDDWLLATHRWLGTASALLLLLTLWISEKVRRAGPASPHARTRYRTLLFGSTLCIALTGFFGGAMVWGIDHYWK